MASTEIFYTLLDENIYLCSQRTIYRMLKPFDFHSGKYEAILENRDSVLLKAYKLNPQRLVNGIPIVERPNHQAWIIKSNTQLLL